MQVRFTPLGKGSNRRSWHMYSPCSNEFKELYQTDELFAAWIDAILAEPKKYSHEWMISHNGN